MNTHQDKTQENINQAVANSLPKLQSNSESAFQFEDNRPEAIAQRKLQEAINNSSRVQQLRAYQEIANNSPQAKQLRAYQAIADNFTSQTKQRNENLVEETLQGKFESIQKKENKTPLPDNLKTGIENLSGYSMDNVKAHYNYDKPHQLQAQAYEKGTDIHLSSGQEKYLPPDTWHVVQQKQRRMKPTLQMKEKVNINDDAGLEKEADLIGAKASQMNAHAKSSTELSTVTVQSQETIQRQLIPDPGGAAYFVDDRDHLHRQQLTQNAGVVNQYTDVPGYIYNYTADEEFLLPNGRYWDVETQRELVKQVQGVKYRYIPNGLADNIWQNRYYYAANHLYVQVPGQRVHWRDNQGHFIDHLNRALTNDGQRVQKHYGVAKDADRNYVVPYKLQTQPFVPGLPNLFGGNMDPGDVDPATTVGREVDEESDWNHERVGPMAPLGAPQIQNGNLLHFYETRVNPRGAVAKAAARPAHPPLAEMAGMFNFKAIDFNIGLHTTDQQIRDRIIAIFEARTGTITADPFFSTVLASGYTPLQEFHNAHSTAALVAKIRADRTSYSDGYARAEAGLVAQHPGNIEYMAGFNLYNDGRDGARGGFLALHHNEPAYMAGFNQYNNGRDRAAQNLAAEHAEQNAYMTGFAQFQNGRDQARKPGINQHPNWNAYNLGFLAGTYYRIGVETRVEGQGVIRDVQEIRDLFNNLGVNNTALV